MSEPDRDPLDVIQVVVDHEANEVRIDGGDLDDAWIYWWLTRALDIASPNNCDDDD